MKKKYDFLNNWKDQNPIRNFKSVGALKFKKNLKLFRDGFWIIFNHRLLCTFSILIFFFQPTLSHRALFCLRLCSFLWRNSILTARWLLKNFNRIMECASPGANIKQCFQPGKIIPQNRPQEGCLLVMTIFFNIDWLHEIPSLKLNIPCLSAQNIGSKWRMWVEKNSNSSRHHTLGRMRNWSILEPRNGLDWRNLGTDRQSGYQVWPKDPERIPTRQKAK